MISAGALLVSISKFKHLLHQSYNFLRVSRSIAKTGFSLCTCWSPNSRLEVVLKKYSKGSQMDPACSGGVSKRDPPSPGAGKVKSGCFFATL